MRNNLKMVFYSMVVILTVLFIASKYRGCNNISSTVDTIKVVKYEEKITVDTIFSVDTLIVNKPVNTIVMIPPDDIDTLELIKKYFSKVQRIDTIINDSNVFVELKQTIYMNDIKKQSVNYKTYPKTMTKITTVNNTVVKYSKGIKAGLFAVSSKDLMIIGISGVYNTKNTAISLGYGYGNNGGALYCAAHIRLNRLLK